MVKFHKAQESGFERKVEMFKHKKNFIYFRENNMLFLKGLMQHPRVKFAFVSTIMRKNIFPIILQLFKKEMGLFSEHMFSLFD